MESPSESVRSVNNDNVGKDALSIYPIVMDSVKTSRSASSDNDDEDEDEEETEEWANHLAVRGNGLSPGSTVRIEHSSDVVIGPVTQFHGPVTIYQNVSANCKPIADGKEPEKSKTEINLKANLSSDNGSRKQHTLAEILEKTSTRRLLLYSSISLSTLIIVIIAIIFSLKIFDKRENYAELTTTSSNANITIYNREAWGGDSIPDGMELLKLPVNYVVIAHTGGSFCETFSECSNIIKNIKSWHSPKDIWYNFLIGGDGSVYVGRGWNLKPIDGEAIVITFIGDFHKKKRLTAVMMSTLQKLLAIGLETHKLDSDYKLVCHNQTKPTLSPGVNVYELVSKMPHFFSGGIKL